jgi:tRNA-dihydrouridine synthase A
VDAVMIGRAAYDNPYLFATVDQAIYGEDKRPLTRQEIAEAMLPYIERWVDGGGKLHTITRHMLQLFAGEPGTRAWKRYLTEQSSVLGAGVEVIQAALQHQTEVLNLRS